MQPVVVWCHGGWCFDQDRDVVVRIEPTGEQSSLGKNNLKHSKLRRVREVREGASANQRPVQELPPHHLIRSKAPPRRAVTTSSILRVRRGLATVGLFKCLEYTSLAE